MYLNRRSLLLSLKSVNIMLPSPTWRNRLFILDMPKEGISGRRGILRKKLAIHSCGQSFSYEIHRIWLEKWRDSKVYTLNVWVSTHRVLKQNDKNGPHFEFIYLNCVELKLKIWEFETKKALKMQNTRYFEKDFRFVLSFDPVLCQG